MHPCVSRPTYNLSDERTEQHFYIKFNFYVFLLLFYKQYNIRYLEVENVSRLFEKYSFYPNLGDQDYLPAMGFEVSILQRTLDSILTVNYSTGY
jgi:hypothetical protein